jgi:hypothetical protein
MLLRIAFGQSAILASRANGPAGLLPGPVYPAPYSPPPAVPQVGNLPSVGFPPLAPTLWDANHPSAVVKGPSFGGDIDIDTTIGGQGDTAVPTMPPIAQPSAPMTLPPLFPELQRRANLVRPKS